MTDRVGRWWPAWYGPGRDDTTLADLLAHASGLAAHRPLYESRRGALAFADAICRMPLDAPPRAAAVYSDLGFILLGVILERDRRCRAGRAGCADAGRAHRRAARLSSAARVARADRVHWMGRRRGSAS